MRNLSMAACLLLGACLHLAPSPDHRLVTAKPKLMSADYRGDSETPERIKKFWSLLARATELEPDNPRVLWVKAVPLLILPPEKGGNLNGAIELYRRMDEVSQATSDADSPLPDWGKPEALMSLAFAHLQQSDLAAAREEAQAALRLRPEWSYVRDVLLPQIEAAQSKEAGTS